MGVLSKILEEFKDSLLRGAIILKQLVGFIVASLDAKLKIKILYLYFAISKFNQKVFFFSKKSSSYWI